jgi:hypothetical protein
MTKSGTSGAGTPKPAGKTDRKARLAEELRSNLARRKAQVRSRRTGDADERAEGLSAGKAGNDHRQARNRGDG